MLETLQVTHRKLGFLKILAILFLFLLKFVKFPSKTENISNFSIFFWLFFFAETGLFKRFTTAFDTNMLSNWLY